MHREYFYKDNRDYLLHQQVEIVEFEEQEFIYKMNEAKSEK